MPRESVGTTFIERISTVNGLDTKYPVNSSIIKGGKKHTLLIKIKIKIKKTIEKQHRKTTGGL